MAWFKDWFNTPYYHVLYGERDENEALKFIDNLLQFIRPKEGARLLDLACGKGRHAVEMASFGYEVYGLDLSEESILEASKKANDKLHFEVHDMRKEFRKDHFDCVFNLFTSFGYFENEEDNLDILRAVNTSLKADGIFVQDYFNSDFVRTHLRSKDCKVRNGIEFRIAKKISKNCIMKTISFDDHNEHHEYTEQVSLFDLDRFREMYASCGLKIMHVFGDYDLNPFEAESSERLILISRKL